MRLPSPAIPLTTRYLSEVDAMARSLRRGHFGPIRRPKMVVAAKLHERGANSGPWNVCKSDLIVISIEGNGDSIEPLGGSSLRGMILRGCHRRPRGPFRFAADSLDKSLVCQGTNRNELILPSSIWQLS